MTRPLLRLALALTVTVIPLLPLPAQAQIPVPAPTPIPGSFSLAQGGVGMRLSERKADFGAVLEVFPGTPAEAAEVKSGDILVQIEGKPVAEVDQPTPGRGLGLALRGEVGTRVTFTVLHEGVSRTVTVQRVAMASFLPLRLPLPPPGGAPVPAP